MRCERREFRLSVLGLARYVLAGLLLLVCGLALADLTTIDIFGQNPTHRYGDVRIRWPSGDALTILGVTISNVLSVVVLGAAIVCAIVGFNLAAVGIAALFYRGPVVTVGPDGLYCWFWGDKMVPWSDIRLLRGVRSLDGDAADVERFIFVDVDQPERFLRHDAPWWKRRSGFLINLHITTTVLDRPPEDLARAILACAPPALIPDKTPVTQAA